MTDEGLRDGDDVCLADERDLDVVDAFNCFYLQLAEANARTSELNEASQKREVTVLLLARVNLAWDLVDARLTFLAANTKNGASRVQQMPALGVARARLRAVLEQPIAYLRQDGRAGEMVAQARRLAERLLAYQGASGENAGATAAPTRPARALACRRSSGALGVESTADLGAARYRRSRRALVRRRYQ
jgi:hypothetical protein